MNKIIRYLFLPLMAIILMGAGFQNGGFAPPNSSSGGVGKFSKITTSSGGSNFTPNVGIGSTAPGAALDVQGTVRVTGSGNTYLGGNVGVSVAAPINNLDVGGNATIGISYGGIQTSPSNGLLIQGSVGIGTFSVNTNYALTTGSIAGTGHSFLVQGSVTNYTGGQLGIGNGDDGASTKNLYIGYNTTADAGFVQAIHQGTNQEPFLINPNGGSISIGTTWLSTPAAGLIVNGNVGISTFTNGNSILTVGPPNVANSSLGNVRIHGTTSSTTGQLEITDNDTGSNKDFHIGLDTTNNRAFIDAIWNGNAQMPIILNQGGGGISVGTTSVANNIVLYGTNVGIGTVNNEIHSAFNGKGITSCICTQFTGGLCVAGSCS